MKRITELKHDEAQKFFLKEESYFTLDLPVYFSFSKILQSSSELLDRKRRRCLDWRMERHKQQTKADHDRRRSCTCRRIYCPRPGKQTNGRLAESTPKRLIPLRDLKSRFAD